MSTYVVIGLGRFGSRVAKSLCSLGSEVLAIDTHPELVQQIANDVTQAVVGDARDKDVLKALGVGNFDCAIVAIGGELSASILTTMNLKELGIPQVICKAHDDTHRKVLEKLGADRVIIPEREIANKLAHSLTSSNVLDYIELSGDYGIVEAETPKMWVGKTLRQTNARAKLGVNIIAVKSNGKINVSPSADYIIEKGDIMVILGDNAALTAVQDL